MLSENDKTQRMNARPRTYYQYVKTSDLRLKFSEAKVISAFTFSGQNGIDKICIMNGHNRRTVLTNIAVMKIKDNVPEKRVLGLSYLGLEPD